MLSKIQIRVFGNLDVVGFNGEKIIIGGSKQQALLSYLAFNTDEPPSRDKLMTLLWGDRFTDQARQSLRQGLSKLRGYLNTEEKQVIWAVNDRVGLDPKLVDVDIAHFYSLAFKKTPEEDELAIQLYKNSLLESLYLREENYENWLLSERSRVNEIAYPIFERLAAYYLNSSEQLKSQQVTQRLVDIDPLRETSHRLLMRIFAQSGQRAAAIKQFNICKETLRRDLDISPDTETMKLLEELKRPTEAGIFENSKQHLSRDPIQKAIEKNDQNRSSKKVTIDDAITLVGSKTNITVLTFDSMKGGEDIEVFSEALTEDTTAALAKYRWLDVVASLRTDNNTTTPQLRQLASEQNINYTVEGSVRQIGGKVRITAQLVDLETGKYIWVNRYDRLNDDLFELIDELNESIAASVETELVAHEGIRARSISDTTLNAWDSYHLGLATQYEFSEEGNARAQSLFRRAIILDPLFAAAHARLAYAIVLSAIYFEADQDSGLLTEALDLAKRATRLDDKDAVARFSLGRVYLARGEYEKSIVELEYAISLNPGLAQAHCGLGDSLAYLGQAEEAIPSFEEAIRLSPQDPHRWAFSTYAAIASIFNSKYQDAVKWAKLSIQVPNSHYWANAALVSALGHLGRTEEANAAVKELLEIKPNFSCDFARSRLFYLKDKQQVEKYVDGLQKSGMR